MKKSLFVDLYAVYIPKKSYSTYSFLRHLSKLGAFGKTFSLRIPLRGA